MKIIRPLVPPAPTRSEEGRKLAKSEERKDKDREQAKLVIKKVMNITMLR